MSTRIGLLHTVPALANAFQRDIDAARDGLELMHIVDASLLDTAIREGVTAEVNERVAAHVAYLQRSGAQAILVTCSSIGESVEAAAGSASIPVLRVDAAMAAAAVETAVRQRGDEDRPGRIAVLATLQATLGPTGRLLQRAAAGQNVQVDATVVDGAAAARADGRPDEHDRLIATAVRDSAGHADVIVLAQASMAEAIADLEIGVPVLTSPRSGIASLIRTLDENS